MKLAAIALVSLVACTSNDDSPSTSKENARGALVGATNSIGSAQKQSANLTTAVHATAPCQSGGTVTLDGDADIGQIQKYDLDAAFAACATPDGTLDGTLHYEYTLNNGAFSAALTGALDWTGAQGAVSCAFDLHVDVGAGVSVRGTVCGYDVGELDVNAGDISIKP